MKETNKWKKLSLVFFSLGQRRTKINKGGKWIKRRKIKRERNKEINLT